MCIRRRSRCACKNFSPSAGYRGSAGSGCAKSRERVLRYLSRLWENARQRLCRVVYFFLQRPDIAIVFAGSVKDHRVLRYRQKAHPLPVTKMSALRRPFAQARSALRSIDAIDGVISACPPNLSTTSAVSSASDGDDDLIENPRPGTRLPHPLEQGRSCKIRQILRGTGSIGSLAGIMQNFRHIERYYLKGREKY